MADRFHPYGVPPPPAPITSTAIQVFEAPESIMRTFLYFSGIYSHTVHFYTRDNQTVTALLWQGIRCDCRVTMIDPNTMELFFHYQNNHARARVSTYTALATFNGTRIWMSPGQHGQYLLEALVARE